MRYLPMDLGTGLLLSVGLLAGSGPAHCPRSHWIVPLSRTRRSKRLPTTTDTPGDIIAVTITAMAITWLPPAILRLWLPTALLWLWLWASLALLRTRRNTNLSSWVQSKPVATSARSLPATGSARWLRGTGLRPTARAGLLCNTAKSRQPFAFHSDALGTPAAGTTRDRIGCSWNLSPAKAVKRPDFKRSVRE